MRDQSLMRDERPCPYLASWIYMLTRELFHKNSLRKFIAPSTLSSQRPLPFHFFYRNLTWRPLRALRETRSYSVFPSFKNFECVCLDFLRIPYAIVERSTRSPWRNARRAA